MGKFKKSISCVFLIGYFFSNSAIAQTWKTMAPALNRNLGVTKDTVLPKPPDGGETLQRAPSSDSIVKVDQESNALGDYCPKYFRLKEGAEGQCFAENSELAYFALAEKDRCLVRLIPEGAFAFSGPTGTSMVADLKKNCPCVDETKLNYLINASIVDASYLKNRNELVSEILACYKDSTQKITAYYCEANYPPPNSCTPPYKLNRGYRPWISYNCVVDANEAEATYSSLLDQECIEGYHGEHIRKSGPQYTCYRDDYSETTYNPSCPNPSSVKVDIGTDFCCLNATIVRERSLSTGHESLNPCLSGACDHVP